MKRIIRYSGIAMLSLSLVMLSLGSMPQTYAGSVGSTMVLATSCGTLPGGEIDWGTGVVLTQVLDTTNTAPLTGFTIDANIQNYIILLVFIHDLNL